MKTIEERVTVLEGRVMEQARLFGNIRETMTRLERRMDAGFERVDARFAQVDARFTQIDARFDTVRKEAFVDFRWIVGIQVTTLVAVVVALLAR